MKSVQKIQMNEINQHCLLFRLVHKVEPRGYRSRRTSRSHLFTTTFQSFRAPPAGRHSRIHIRILISIRFHIHFHFRNLIQMHIHFPICSHTPTLSPTGSTSLRPRTGRPQGRGRTCQVKMTLRRRRTRRKRRLLLPGGRGLNLYLKLIRNMLKVRGHTDIQCFLLFLEKKSLLIFISNQCTI